jgi:hypothetical protein
MSDMNARRFMSDIGLPPAFGAAGRSTARSTCRRKAAKSLEQT